MIRHFVIESAMWALTFIGVGGIGIAAAANFIGII
jgi:hypothetical protein